jgi:hypothetical protein
LWITGIDALRIFAIIWCRDQLTARLIDQFLYRLGIPTKPNAKSGMIPNGILG